VQTTVTLYRDPMGAEIACQLRVDDPGATLAMMRSAAHPTRLAAYERGGEVRVYPVPEDPVTAISIGVAVLALGYAVYQHYNAPEAVVPNEVDYVSPNNRLGNRSNRLRPQARVPDIYGTLRAVPDLVQVPYRTYVDHRQVETVLACVGRGRYNVSLIREGDVPLADLEGYGADVYAPGTWPGSGSPQLTVGTPPTDGPMLVSQVTVPEDELVPPNEAYFQGDGDVRLKYPNRVETTSSDTDWTTLFPVGSQVELFNVGTLDPPDPDGGGPDPDPTPFTIASGPYTVATVGTNFITLTNPHLVDADWNRLDDFAGGNAPYGDARIEEENPNNWLGPVFGSEPGDRVILSVVAPDGLYRPRADGSRSALTISFQVRLTPCDEDGASTGSPVTVSSSVAGSPTEGGLRAKTLVVTAPDIGLACYKIEVRRSTSRAYGNDDVDSIYWAETYVCKSTSTAFDDVTLIHARAQATASGRVDQFQLSALVTRKLTPWNGTIHTGTPTATASAARAAAAICLDPYVGGLAESDCDFQSLYDAEDIVQGWFDHDAASQFSYTFDSENMGFEDMLATALRAGFMTVFRDGPLLKFRADLPSDPVLLLNPRVVLPGSHTCQIQLGPPDGEHDGVELRYMDVDTGEQLDLLVPHDGVQRPRKLETAGVTDARQARYHAWREWNRLRYVRETARVVVTGEGQLAQVGDVVLLSDGLRPGTRHGEAVGGGDFFLETPADESDVGMPATLHVQLNDGTVASGEVLAYLPGPPIWIIFNNSDVLGNLTTDPQAYARATYTLVPGAEPEQLQEYEVSERQPNGREWSLDLVRHTFMRFSFDRLAVWLPLHEAIDWGPDARTVTDGSGTYATDAGRDGTPVLVGAGDPVVPAGLTLDLGAGVSMTCWVRSDAAGTVMSVDDLEFSIGPDGTTQVDVDSQATLTGSRPLTGWSHVGFTIGGGELWLYVGGEVVTAGSASLSGTHTPVLLDLVGRASDLRVWRSVLSASDVRTLAAETRVSVLA
jgi:hypothetical protein